MSKAFKPEKSEPQGDDLSSLHTTFRDQRVVEHLKLIVPAGYAAASKYWETALGCELLTPRMRELILLALHATITSNNSDAITKHVDRALASGASEQDIMDVLLSIVGVSNHALYAAVPVLLSELQERGEESQIPEAGPQSQALKESFIKARGFWNEQRDTLARCMPEYVSALNTLSTEPWKSGSLNAKERELVYIAIDSSVTHMYGPGLRLHIRRALDADASVGEILEVFQLVAATGMEGFICGAHRLWEVAERDEHKSQIKS